MIKLVALKRLYYPRGPGGKEYQRGDTFEALSERDAKALTLVRAAQAEEVTPLKVADPQPARRGRPPKARVETTDAPATDEAAATYTRRDMRAED